ncbi:MAG: hypothetical protein V4557_10370 [Bacteroidota bacterium]
MNYLPRIVLIAFIAVFAVGSVQAQKKSSKKTVKQKTATPKKKEDKPVTVIKEAGDTSAPKVVTITSAFKPFLKDAAKVNFTAATPVIDSSKIPVAYTIPSQNLFFLYQPVSIKPLALLIDTGFIWENDQYIKVGAGNFSTYYGEAAFSFGDGKNSITNIRGNFLTSTGHLPAQQAAKWGVDLISIFNTKNNHEWTAHPFYQSSTQYLYGYLPSTLSYTKESLLQQFSTVGLELGMQNKTANSFGITYHPQISAGRFFDNNEAHENYLLIKAPVSKSFGKIYSFNLGLTADISTTTFPLIPNPLVIHNNLYYLNPSIQFKTPNVKINAGIQPTWDNKTFYLLPDLTAEAKFSEINLSLEAGWQGYFQKNTYRSLANFNPWIGRPGSLKNTKINEQFAGVKGTQGDHFTYHARVSLLTLDNQPLFTNALGDGKTFNVVYDTAIKAVRLHGEIGYTDQEKLSITAGATFTKYSAGVSYPKAYGLLPLEITGSLKWKILKDLQVKSDVFVWDGAQYLGTAGQGKAKAVADLNLGAEFTVMPRLNLWIQMNNLLNSTYQRWNQYSVLGFNVLGGVVYSFR